MTDTTKSTGINGAAPGATGAPAPASSAPGRAPRVTVERLLDAYSEAQWRERVHVYGRWRSCPFDALAAHVPATGRVLDLGCGHGLLSLHLALGSSRREVTGLDIDRDKIAVAQQAAHAARVDNVTFGLARPGDRPVGEWDAITIVDMLYLLGPAAAEAMVAAAAAALAPGGVLLVKEMALEPRWKYQLTRAQEVVATRVVRITEGAHLALVPPSAIAGGMDRAGLSVVHRPLDKGRLHPHHLVVGRRPAL
jgi:2-polyprenyl-3-methyl-5-hydroxy-6-metoxy-1,4-benzoquinol methylase